VYTLCVLPAERKRRILAHLRDHREASVKGLAEMLHVQASAVRRDLRELEAENRPSLVAVPTQEEDSLEPALADELLEEAAHVLSDVRSAFLAGGSLMCRIAAKLAGKTIVTHDLAIAMAAASSGNDVSVVGREVDNDSMTLRSSSFDAELNQYYFDVAVVEAEAVDDKNLWVGRKNHGFLGALLQRADSFVSIAKSNTIGRKGARVATPLSRADLLVVDRGADEEARRTLADSGVELRVAGESHGEAFGFDQVGNLHVFRSTADRFSDGG